ncbi:MAG TPA: flagellar biosynthetic protein FliR [Spirochaetia bacterium]|nr:flagellar biosynthetic protein FliR [Spirochaetia bacterium]
MSLDFIVQNSQLFLLVFVRILAIVELAPLLSTSGVPQIARIGLAFFVTSVVFPGVMTAGYPIPPSALEYGLLIVGEILIGIIIAFFLVIVYTAFNMAGEFFSLQMGFGASQVFDPLAQIEIPIMGQFVNSIAMFIFILVGGFQKLFLVGIAESFRSVRAVDFVIHRNDVFQTMIGSLAALFSESMIIAFPILGTLLLVSVGMGLLAKAAPQMNLLTMGFPITIMVAFLVLFLTMPFLVETVAGIVQQSFDGLGQLLMQMRGTR